MQKPVIVLTERFLSGDAPDGEALRRAVLLWLTKELAR